MRAQRDCHLIASTMPDLSGLSIECSRSFVRRTIWDGQQELAEIQAPDNATDREKDSTYFSAQALINGKDPNPYYGRAIYTYGHTIDQPLSIFRLGYADWPQGAASYTTTAWGTFVVMPFWDATGNAKIGAFGTGAAVRQLSGPPPAACQNPNNSPQRCVKLYWPETFTALDRLKGFTPQMYVGSLLDQKRNASGTEFKRNRVYDPKTGRFTQEDPIGLAGGLNLYGFANGDPVNFSDPFGLCPPQSAWTPECDKPLESAGFFDPPVWITGGVAGGIRKLFARAFAKAATASASSAGPAATNPALQRTVSALFSPRDRIAGGTAGAIRHEASTGRAVGGRFHLQKGIERIRNLENILAKEGLSAADRVIAERLLGDLRSAVDFAQEMARRRGVR